MVENTGQGGGMSKINPSDPFEPKAQISTEILVELATEASESGLMSPGSGDEEKLPKAANLVQKILENDGKIDDLEAAFLRSVAESKCVTAGTREFLRQMASTRDPSVAQSGNGAKVYNFVELAVLVSSSG